MKLKKVVLATLLNLAVFSTTANANIFIHPTFTGVGDACAIVAGNWTGTGTATAGVRCRYKGKAVVTNIENNRVFDLATDLTKISGILCPQEEHIEFVGTCVNGVLTVDSNGANLTGTTDGKKAHLSGTVEIPIQGVPVKAQVSMDLTKQ